MVLWNYIGSKHNLIPFIEKIIRLHVSEELKTLIFADLFAGTGSVSFGIGKHFRKVISCDLEYYSKVICSSLLKTPPHVFNQLSTKINEMNNLTPIEGNVSLNYSSKSADDVSTSTDTKSSNTQRNYFTRENAGRIDACLKYLDDLTSKKLCPQDEIIYLLACLLEAADRVANIASVYGAFLKDFKKDALVNLTIKHLSSKSDHDPVSVASSQPDPGWYQENEVHCQNSIDLASTLTCDLAYIDPPYNKRQYGSNYHVLNYIAKNGKAIGTNTSGPIPDLIEINLGTGQEAPLELYGLSGLIKDYERSTFCSRKKAIISLDELTSRLTSKYILMSYNNEGVMSIKDIYQILSKKGKVYVYKTVYNKFKSSKNTHKEADNVPKKIVETDHVQKNIVYEYLFFVNTTLPTCKIDKSFLCVNIVKYNK